ncbi:MAG: hypothetical protein F4Z33_10125, partial [Gemmatimonadales bacterium]|nr:hypothetical protein [Gemmatimonadales bacterium]
MRRRRTRSPRPVRRPAPCRRAGSPDRASGCARTRSGRARRDRVRAARGRGAGARPDSTGVLSGHPGSRRGRVRAPPPAGRDRRGARTCGSEAPFRRGAGVVRSPRSGRQRPQASQGETEAGSGLPTRSPATYRPFFSVVNERRGNAARLPPFVAGNAGPAYVFDLRFRPRRGRVRATRFKTTRWVRRLMFMRKMRGSASLVMGIMAAAFVGWLVFDGINAMQGGNLGGQINPVVGQVGGQDIRYNEWNIFLQNQLAVNRAADRSMTDEDVRVVTERAWESLISATLIQAELDRLGVSVTDAEVRQAFFTQPPQEMLSYPGFQTDGQFDIDKYRRFFTDPATDETQLLQIEGCYRSILPRAKLQTLVQSG